MMIEFEQSDLSWLDGLPATPRRILIELIEGGTSPEDAIELWFSASRQGNIAPMGGIGNVDKSTFSALFFKELRLLICTNDAKYKGVRDQLPKINRTSLVSVTGIVSTALAPHLGMATAMIAPAVVLAFIAIGKISVEAWCARGEALTQ